jgi:hypothetical protein
VDLALLEWVKLASQVAVDLALQEEVQLEMLLAVHLGSLAWKNCALLETFTKLIQADFTFLMTVDLASNEVVELAFYLAVDLAGLKVGSRVINTSHSGIIEK